MAVSQLEIEYVGVSYMMSAATVFSECAGNCGLDRAARCLPRPSHHIFSFKFWGLAILKQLSTETRVNRTKFGIVQFILFTVLSILLFSLSLYLYIYSIFFFF